MDRYLWKFDFDCGRMGNLEGLFVATEYDINNIIGKHVYFGEVLGKHSEIYGDIVKDEIIKLDLDCETVEKVSNLLGDTWSGFNPLHYIQYYCPICEENYKIYDFNKEKDICIYCEEKQ
jgi:hypothetical protein